MVRSLRRMTGLALVLAVCIAGVAAAQSTRLPALSTSAADVSADRIEYDPSGPYVIGRGNVLVRQDDRAIRADYVRVHTRTQEAYARGNVVLSLDDVPTWKGEELTYNLRTGEGDFGAFRLHVPPFYYLWGERSEVEGLDEIRIERPGITPCEEEDAREFRITARRARLRDQRILTLRHATAWVGPVPILYTPYWRKNLDALGRLELVPGHSSRLGAFLLSRYTLPLDDAKQYRSRTHLNLYEHRGVGVGQDLLWDLPDRGTQGHGYAFVIRDQQLYHSDAEERARARYLDDPLRYRLQLSHTQPLSDRDRLYLDAAYLSDPYVQQDFFRREHRASPVPDNRLVLTHRGDAFSASLLVDARLNDFFQQVERLPEARMDIHRLRIADTRFFYEGQISAASLRRVFPFDAEDETESTARLDADHRVYYPGRYFRFLTLIPRVGLRTTYYSDTRGRPRMVVRTEPRFDEELDEWVDDLVEDMIEDEGGAELRAAFEVGMESFFKAFRVYHNEPWWLGEGLRHVVEPYADYTWRPQPNLRPGRLFQFDEIDRIDLNHSLRPGVRNRWQVRREDGGIRDVLDVDVFTRLRVETLPGQNTMGPIQADIRFRPHTRFWLDVDAAYDVNASQLDALNSRVRMVASDGSSLGVEYRYRAEDWQSVLADWSFRPRHRWSLNGWHRVDLEEGRLMEHVYAFTRRHNCVGWSLGVQHEPAFEDDDRDEVRVWMMFWLLADPESGLRIGRVP